ncbi:MAG: response regulator [Polyangiales bacterium]
MLPDPTHPRVLVVDDDDDIRTLVASVLEEEGFSVATAQDGLDALAEVERRMPDVILLDMKMPRMDGQAFARAFHARFDGGAKIIVFTAAENARGRAADVGADAVVGKPFDIDVLVKAVREQGAARALG